MPLVEITISSLHIGQISVDLVEAAAAPLLSSLWSKDTLALRSCGSVDAEIDELTEMELVEGDCKLVVRGGRAAAAGERFLPLPNTLPPSSVRAAIVRQLRECPCVRVGGLA